MKCPDCNSEMIYIKEELAEKQGYTVWRCKPCRNIHTLPKEPQIKKKPEKDGIIDCVWHIFNICPHFNDCDNVRGYEITCDKYLSVNCPEGRELMYTIGKELSEVMELIRNKYRKEYF
jgi:transposase-like protein